jgi:lipopolysaccharide assembly outer membrane protein LptD (OstA)
MAFLMGLCAQAVAATGDTNLTADAMRYDPSSGEINATGNVRLSRPDGEIFGDAGSGNVSGRGFEMSGSVRGTFTEEGVDIECAFIRLSSEGESPAMRTITASGDVVLTRGEDIITAQYLSWELDRDGYTARGDVEGSFESHIIDADEAYLKGDDFSAKGVRRYEDLQRGLTFTARSVNGKLSNGRMAELVADGDVVMNSPDASGTMTSITGSRGIYSVDRGTVVVSGGANATQSGRHLRAGSIVYHLDSGRIEALDRPSLVIEFAGQD